MRRRRAGEPAKLDHCADERVDFGIAASFDVLQHRSLVLADSLGARDALFQRDAEFDAEPVRHVLGLPHHVRGELARERELTDIDERRVTERTDRVEGEVAPELEPDLGADVVEDRRLEAALLKRLG